MARSAGPKVQTWRDGIGTMVDGRPWTFFATFTTPYEMSLKAARRLCDRVHGSWSRLSDDQCTMFWVAERNECRDGHHVHALVDVPEKFRAPQLYGSLIESYQWMVGAKAETIDRETGEVKYTGRGRIDLRKFDNRRNATSYLTKYVTKGDLADWDFLTSRR